LSPLFFNFVLDYAIRKIQEDQEGLKLNWIHQLLAYADDVNREEGNINIIKKNTEVLLDATNEVGLEVNAEKTMCMFMSNYQKAVEKHSIKIANWSFEDVAKFKYLGQH
jgi:hypothetical protein